MDKILLFIPAYNCEKQITRVLDKVKKYDDFFEKGIYVSGCRYRVLVYRFGCHQTVAQCVFELSGVVAQFVFCGGCVVSL